MIDVISLFAFLQIAKASESCPVLIVFGSLSFVVKTLLFTDASFDTVVGPWEMDLS